MRASDLFRPLSALLAVVLFLTVNVAAERQIPHRGCGTGPPSSELYDAHKKLHQGSQASQDRTATANTTNTTNTTPTQSNSPLPVKVYFHIVSTHDQAQYVTESMVYAQVRPSLLPSLPPSLPFPSPPFHRNVVLATRLPHQKQKEALTNPSTSDVWKNSS